MSLGPRKGTDTKGFDLHRLYGGVFLLFSPWRSSRFLSLCVCVAHFQLLEQEELKREDVLSERDEALAQVCVMHAALVSFRLLATVARYFPGVVCCC